jgi:thymidylate kinase
VLLFDLPAETARARIQGRGDRLNAFEETAYQSRVRDLFLSVLAGSSCGVKLDATQPQRTVWQQALHSFLTQATRKVEAHILDPGERKKALLELID